MRIAERLLWIIAALAVAMKLLHIPLASSLLIISVSALMMLYFFLSWLVLPTPTRQHQHIGLSIVSGLAFTFLLEGILFKVQVWPMASFNLLVGFMFGAVSIIAAIMTRKGRRDLTAYTNGILIRAVPLIAIGALLYPVSARRMMRFHHRSESPQRLELYDRMYSTDDPIEKERIWLQLDSLDAAEHRAHPVQ